MNTTCEFCGANLTRQDGFDPSLDIWACRNCGYENGTGYTAPSANDISFDDFDFDDFLKPKAKKSVTTKAAAPVSEPILPKSPAKPVRHIEPKYDDDYEDEEEDYSYNNRMSSFDDDDYYEDEGSSAGSVVKNIFLILVMLYSILTIVHQLLPDLLPF